MRLMLVPAFVLVLISMTPTPVPAGQKAHGAAVNATVSATIEAIDSTNRLVTLKFADGTVNTVWAGPEVRRFSELKVGDTVTFRYHESAIVQLRKAGDAAAAPSSSEGIVRRAGGKPGAAMAKQINATVTVEAIDPAVPSITVKTDDGSRVTFHVEHKENLDGVKAGDRIEITYTQALMISVEGAK